MQRFTTALLIAFLLPGCGTSPVDSESTREVVLQYLGGDVGTAGPFGKGGKKELGSLSAEDRRRVEELIDNGSVIFLVFGANAANRPTGTEAGGVNRIVVVQKGKIVGDFAAAPVTPSSSAAK